MPELWIYEPGVSQPHKYLLSQDTYRLGRSSRCEIVINQERVSQVHLSIIQDAQHPKKAFVIRDEKSTNGVYQGNNRIEQKVLKDGDRFTLGPDDGLSVRIEYHTRISPNPGTPPPLLSTVISQSQTLLNQAVQTLFQGKWSQLILKPNAKVPELWVYEPGVKQPQKYPLLGEFYSLGRSRQCNIVVGREEDPIVSSIHLTLTRDRQRRYPFVMTDKSLNGVYLKKNRVDNLSLRHGDLLTLGPPELTKSVTLKYVDPSPWYVTTWRYGVYGVSGIAGILALWVLWEWTKFDVTPLPQSVTGPVVVYARDGQTPLRPLHNNAHRELKEFRDFSPYLPQAVIASEDSRYYWHLGVDPMGIGRALWTNLRGGGIREGGSTLTQQLARSLFRDYVGTQDSADRKLKEAIVALKLEWFYNKKELLLTYLNRVFLGIDLYGFDDASRFYFNKSAKDLTLSEAATLVGILPAPNSFNPIQNYQLAVEYRDRVIARMLERRMISQEEADRARRSRIEINPKAVEFLRSTIAPYFYDYVFAELQFLLGKQVAREGNFIVETSLNPDVQKLAESSLKSTLSVQGNSLKFTQGALVSLDSTNGDILAMVGGHDYLQSQFNRVTQAQRQPGSTFKVFAYSAALEKGISPEKGYSCQPLNWSGQSFAGCQRSGGSINMFQGLALSENPIALRIAQEVGLGATIDMAKRLGVQSSLQSTPGLILGQSEVNLLEITGAFSVFANQGISNRPHAINRILDSSDCQDIKNLDTCRVIYNYQRDPMANRNVLTPEIADTMTQLLQGVIREGTGKNAILGLGEAGKTGTTNDNVDLWFIGYIPQQEVTTGIWLGNDDNTPTLGSSMQAAQLWADYMSKIKLTK